MKYKFIAEEEDHPYSGYSARKLTFEFNADDLSTILSSFEDFLKGNGFLIDGYLDIVKDDEYIPASNDDEGNNEDNIVFSNHSDEFAFMGGAAQPSMDFSYLDDGITISNTDNININDETAQTIQINPFANSNIAGSAQTDTKEKCPVCRLTVEQMKGMHCFDQNCGLKKNKAESYYT